MRALVVAMVFVIAGCTGKPVGSDAAEDLPGDGESGILDPIGDLENRTEDGSPPLFLTSLTRQALETQTMQIRAEAGSWVAARLILTPELWNESLPWDGEAEVRLGYTLEASTGGYQFLGVLHKSPFDESSHQTRTWSTTSEEGRGHITVRATAQTDGPMPPPPLNEIVLLIGHPHDAVSLRVGLIGSEGGAQGLQDALAKLDEREAQMVTPDDRGMHGFAGAASLVWTGSQWDSWSQGPVEAQADHGVGPLAAMTASRMKVNATIPASGTLGLRASVYEQAGIHQWNYSLHLPERKLAGGGSWSAPALPNVNGLLATGGLLRAPEVAFDGRVDAGRLAFDLTHRFTGLRPVPVSVPTYQQITVGFADIDLQELYGWPHPQSESGEWLAGQPISLSSDKLMEVHWTDHRVPRHSWE